MRIWEEVGTGRQKSFATDGHQLLNLSWLRGSLTVVNSEQTGSFWLFKNLLLEDLAFGYYPGPEGLEICFWCSSRDWTFPREDFGYQEGLTPV